MNTPTSPILPLDITKHGRQSSYHPARRSDAPYVHLFTSQLSHRLEDINTTPAPRRPRRLRCSPHLYVKLQDGELVYRS